MRKSLWVAGSALASVLFAQGASATAVPAASGLEPLYGQRLDVCLSDLSMLQTFSQARYTQQAAALNAEVGRATHYLMLRDQLSQDMRPVMDKIYQARLTSQCQSVHNALFDVLLSQANNAGQNSRGAG
ncbi:hypothetical protein I5M86_00150 [Serratia marcescens]|nr:hypothetical protein [Serratia marcescens]MBH3063794.1 hypothetical protein [Serratia marcescens]